MNDLKKEEVGTKYYIGFSNRSLNVWGDDPIELELMGGYVWRHIITPQRSVSGSNRRGGKRIDFVINLEKPFHGSADFQHDFCVDRWYVLSDCKSALREGYLIKYGGLSSISDICTMTVLACRGLLLMGACCGGGDLELLARGILNGKI